MIWVEHANIKGDNDSGKGRDHALPGEKPDAGPFDVNTHHPRDVGIVTDKHDALTELVSVQDEPQQHGQPQRPERLKRHSAKQSPYKKLVDEIILASLECHLQSAREQNRDAVPEKIRGEGCHNRWYADACDHHAVDIPHQSASGEGQPDADPGTVGWIK